MGGSEKKVFWISVASFFGMVMGWVMPASMPVWVKTVIWWVSFPAFTGSIIFLLFILYKDVIKPRIQEKRHMWPIILIGLGVLLFGIGIVSFYIQQAKLTATPSQPLSGPASQPTPELAKPKKFYSQRNKSDLADALTDLSEIINTTGASVTQKAQQIFMIWGGEAGKNKMPDTAALIERLNDLRNLTGVFSQALYSDNGFMKKYQVYSDELNSILQVQQKGPSSPDNPISILVRNIDVARDVLSSIDYAKKYNDQELISYMMRDSRPAFDKYFNGMSAFRGWLDETQKRIHTFRNSQL